MLSKEAEAVIDRAFEAPQEEMKKDIFFFGGIGAFIGFLANSFDQADKKGIKLSVDFINDLLSDFMSIKAITLIFLLVVLICALRNIAHNYSCSWTYKLQSMAAHMALRLQQFSSSLMCFSIGFSAFLVLSYPFTYEVRALLLAALSACVGAGVYIVAVASHMLEAGVGASHRTTWSIILMCFSVLCIGYLGMYGY